MVDVEDTETAASADLFLRIKTGRDFEALWVLRAVAKGVVLDDVAVHAETGVSLEAGRT